MKAQDQIEMFLIIITNTKRPEGYEIFRSAGVSYWTRLGKKGGVLPRADR